MNEREINNLIALMNADDSTDAPPDARRWAKNIFLTRAAAPKKSVVRKILAVLQMDLPANRAAFGERSASASQARQMFFQTDENAVDLRIVANEKSLSVHGQILGETSEDCAVIISSADASFETQINEMREFKFVEIPPGIYAMRLKSGEQEIVIENLELR